MGSSLCFACKLTLSVVFYIVWRLHLACRIYLFSTQVSVFINLALRLAPAVDVVKFISSSCILYTYQLDIYCFCKRLPGLLEARKIPNCIQPVAVYFTFSLPCIVIQLLKFKRTNAHSFIEITIKI